MPPCIRRVDNGKTYPADFVGNDVHADGEIWSGTLWDIWNALGKTVTDVLVLESHYVNGGEIMYRQGGSRAEMWRLKSVPPVAFNQGCSALNG